MTWLPFFVGVPILCFVMSYGLMHRSAWMWHLGLAMLYLFAAYVGGIFFPSLLAAQDNTAMAYSFAYLLGGLVLWLPLCVWWAKSRSIFGKKPGTSGGGKSNPAA